MDVTHGLTKVEFLGLEETLFHLDGEIVRLVSMKQKKIEVLDHDWFHLEHLLDRFRLKRINLIFVEYLVFDAFVVQSCVEGQLEAPCLSSFLFSVAKEKIWCPVSLVEGSQKFIFFRSFWVCLYVKTSIFREFLKINGLGGLNLVTFDVLLSLLLEILAP